MNNKNQKDFIDAMGNIDDEIIQNALSYKKKNKVLNFKKYISIAACFAVVVVSAFVGFRNYKKDAEILGDNHAGDISENAADKESSYELNEDINMPAPDEGGNKSELYFDDNFGNSSEASGNLSEDKTENSGNSSEKPSWGFEGIFGENETTEETPSIKEEVHPGNSLPSLTEQVEIDDLNKLAYYSGWTMLRKYGTYNVKGLSCKVYGDELKLLTSIGYDVSDEDTPIGTVYIPNEGVESSNDFQGLVPIDPGFGGDVVAYGIYSITVKSVEYFQIQIVNDCFLASQIGKGHVEVMILEVDFLEADFQNKISDTMILFKNGDRYFSCILDTILFKENNEKTYTFTASKYVSNFSIVKMPELACYSFVVNYYNNSTSVPQITFKFSDSVTFYTSSETYNNAKNLNITNTAYGLTQELYKIYLEDVVAGTKEPILPEKPTMPDYSQEQQDDKTLIDVSFSGLYTDKASFSGENGYLLFEGGSSEAKWLKNQMTTKELSTFIDTIPDEILYVALWVEGRVRFSDYQFFISNGTKLEFVFNYIVFEEADDMYTLFLFELGDLINVTEVNKHNFNNVNYTQTTSATFTTVNEYDYLPNNTKEDEYIINFHEEGFYRLYKNEVFIYQNGYKITEGYVVLCTDEDTFYLELSPISTFVYKIEGRNRIFSLEN